jgi:hypothetical protein
MVNPTNKVANEYHLWSQGADSQMDTKPDNIFQMPATKTVADEQAGDVMLTVHSTLDS